MVTKRFTISGFLLFVIIAVIPTASLSARAQTGTNKVPLTHETMWMLKRVGAPTPSPDGKWVVFSLVEPAYDENYAWLKKYLDDPGTVTSGAR